MPGSFWERDKYIKVEDGHSVTKRQTGEVQIKICDNNGKPFIDTIYSVLLAPDLCDQLFSIIELMNLGHTWLFHKWFCTILFSDNEHNVVKLPHSAQRKHIFLVKIKEKSKPILYIPYATSSNEQTGYIITFSQFEKGNLVENECREEEDE